MITACRLAALSRREFFERASLAGIPLPSGPSERGGGQSAAVKGGQELGAPGRVGATGRGKEVWKFSSPPCLARPARVQQGNAKAATKACELTQWKDSYTLSTLAAAFAETRDFQKAVKYQKQVLSMDGLTNNDREEEQQRLDYYERREPFREPRKRKRKRFSKQFLILTCHGGVEPS